MNLELINDFIEYCNQFGYEPTIFPKSSDDPNFQEVVSYYGCSLKEFWEKRNIKFNFDEVFGDFGYKWAIKELESSQFVSKDKLKHFFCGEFPSNDFNARCIKTENGYICMLNRGMRSFIYNMALSIMFWHYCENDDESRKNPIQNKLDRMSIPISVCYKYIRGYSNFNIDYPTTIDEKIVSLANTLSYSMRLFVVAHEFAHLQFGHADGGRVEPQISKERFKFVKGDTYIDSEFAKTEEGFNFFFYMVEYQEDEYEADQFAQHILLDIASKDEKRIIPSGGLCVLVLSMIIELIQKKLFPNSQQVISTYPDASDRIKKLLGVLKKLNKAEYEGNVFYLRHFYDFYEMLKEMKLEFDGNRLHSYFPDYLIWAKTYFKDDDFYLANSIFKILDEELNTDFENMKPDTDISDPLVTNNLAVILIVSKLEDTFNIEIDIEDYCEKITCFNNLLEYIKEKIEAKKA